VDEVLVRVTRASEMPGKMEDISSSRAHHNIRQSQLEGAALCSHCLLLDRGRLSPMADRIGVTQYRRRLLARLRPMG
jgi:hypothetical protein